MSDKCFACGKPLIEGYLVGCADDQDVGVGPECYRKIRAGAEAGYQPPLGGPRLYLLQFANETRRARAAIRALAQPAVGRDGTTTSEAAERIISK